MVLIPFNIFLFWGILLCSLAFTYGVWIQYKNHRLIGINIKDFIVVLSCTNILENSVNECNNTNMILSAFY